MEIGLRGCTGGDGIERRFGCAVVVPLPLHGWTFDAHHCTQNS